MSRLCLGVDVAKASVEVAVRWAGGEQAWGAFDNSPAGFEQLRQRVSEPPAGAVASEVLVVLEPSGGYELALAAWAHQQDWLVSRPNPKRVRDWAKGQGRRAKTDRVDARDLARYGAEQPLARWQPLPPALSELESLLRRQEDLEKLRQEERNRQAALAAKPGVAAVVHASLAAVLSALDESLRQIQQALKAHVQAHAPLRAKLRLLRSVPGVGEKNSLYVLLLLARWDHLTEGRGAAKALVAFAGLDPQTHESGTSVHRAATISRMGEAQTRRMLYLGALGGVSGHNPLREFYQRLVGRGKAKKLALTASARKILIWAWAVYRYDHPFTPERATTRMPAHVRA